MMNPIFNNIFMISLSCTGIAILLLAVRKLIGKNTGAWWRSFIWVLILIRLCIPVLIETPIGIINRDFSESAVNNIPATQPNTHDTAPQEYSADTADTVMPESSNDAVIAHIPANNNPNNNPNSFSWISLVNDIYMFGLILSFLILLLRIAILNFRVSKLKQCTDKAVLKILNDIKQSYHIRRNIMLVVEDKNTVPALCGLISPVIIVPQSTIDKASQSELKYIFIHELTHYKRMDIAKLWLLELVTCIHWFNPILHLIKPAIVQDIELACDEQVISKISASEYANYGNVLVNCSTRNRAKHPLVVTSNFAGKRGNKLKERLVMIKKYNRVKIMTAGIILVIVLAAILVACSTAVSKTEINFDNAYIKVAYFNETFWDIEDENSDVLIEQLNSDDMQIVSADAFDITDKNNFIYVIHANDKQYNMFRLDGRYDMIFVQSQDNQNELYYYNSSVLGDLLDKVEIDYIKAYEVTRYDDMLLDIIHHLIEGTRTIENVVADTDEWDAEDNKFSTKMYLYSHISVTFSVHPGDDNLDRALDYSKDILIVDYAQKDESITNPTNEELMAFLFDEAGADNIEQDIFDSADTDSIVHDINQGEGSILELLMDLAEGTILIGNLTEEFSLPYDDGAYRLTLLTTTDEYELELYDNGGPIDSMLDYNVSKLVIKNSTDGWTLENPTSEQIQELMMEEYYAQREDWKEDNVESRFSGNFIEVVSPDGAIRIDLTDKEAEDIKLHMMASSVMIVITDYRGTDEEFHMKGLEIFLEGMNYEYPVPLWVNDFGTKAIGFGGELIPVSASAYDMIEAIAIERAGYVEGDIHDIHDLVSVELKVKGSSQGIVTDSNSVQEIETLLLSSEKMNGIGGCPFGAELIMTRADGQVIRAAVPTDSCGYFILGTGACYQYDRRDSNDVRQYEQEDLLKYFGMQSFDEARNVRWDIAELDIGYAMDVVRDYYKAIEDEDAALLANCVHPDRYSVDATFFDEFDDINITLDNIYDYSSEHQIAFNHSLDMGDAMLVIVQVDFTVEYLINSPNTPYNAGQYTGWNFILIREGLGSPWKIYDQGY